jgi:hypothetical protein
LFMKFFHKHNDMEDDDYGFLSDKIAKLTILHLFLSSLSAGRSCI